MTGANKVTNFDDDLKVRLEGTELKRIKKLVRITTDFELYPKYDSVSHFVRCAVLRLIRLETENNIKQKINLKFAAAKKQADKVSANKV